MSGRDDGLEDDPILAAQLSEFDGREGAQSDGADERKEDEDNPPGADKKFDGFDERMKKFAERQPKAKANRGAKLNKNLVMSVGFAVCLAGFVFFQFIRPILFAKKRGDDNELDKAGKAYIPEIIASDEIPSGEAALEEMAAAETFADERSDEEILRELPPFDDEPPQEEQPQPRQTTASANYYGGGIDTRKNPMQKRVARMAWDDAPLPQEAQLGAAGGMFDAISGRYMPYQAVQGAQSDRAAALQSALAGLQGSGGQFSGGYAAQNGQQNKIDFAQAGAGQGGQSARHSLAAVHKGTIIPMVLETGINTDLPGVVIARVTKNIYSSFDGRHLIIPEGSRVLATYNSSITYAQNRVQVVWNTLLRPDGLEVNLGNMNGVDLQGYSGYKGFKNGHPLEYAKALGLIAGFSILTTGFSVVAGNLSNNIYAQNALIATGQQVSQFANEVTQRALDIQPTITVKNGTEIDLITNVTLDLPPMEIPEVNQRYVRQK